MVEGREEEQGKGKWWNSGSGIWCKWKLVELEIGGMVEVENGGNGKWWNSGNENGGRERKGTRGLDVKK